MLPADGCLLLRSLVRWPGEGPTRWFRAPSSGRRMLASGRDLPSIARQSERQVYGPQSDAASGGSGSNASCRRPRMLTLVCNAAGLFEVDAMDDCFQSGAVGRLANSRGRDGSWRRPRHSKSHHPLIATVSQLPGRPPAPLSTYLPCGQCHRSNLMCARPRA